MKATSKVKHGQTLKQGSITSTNELNLIRRVPDMTGACPLLLADLSDEMGMPSTRLDTSVSAEVVHASEQAIYLFRLQIGATLVCWLADPHDPEIHNLLQQWAKADYMFAALKTDEGVMVRSRLVCGIPPSIKAVHKASGQMDTGRFIRSTIEVFTSGVIRAQAKSDIPLVQRIRKIRAFFILGKAAQEAEDMRLCTRNDITELDFAQTTPDLQFSTRHPFASRTMCP